MINNVAFDVVIGNIFIFLLYSLPATVVAEIIATKFGLRAGNLKEALNRIVTDKEHLNPTGRLCDVSDKWFLGKMYRIGDHLNARNIDDTLTSEDQKFRSRKHTLCVKHLKRP